MPRVIGIDIPDNKRLEISLMYIYGVGRHLSNEICAKLGLDPNMKAQNLTLYAVSYRFHLSRLAGFSLLLHVTLT